MIWSVTNINLINRGRGFVLDCNIQFNLYFIICLKIASLNNLPTGSTVSYKLTRDARGQVPGITLELLY